MARGNIANFKGKQAAPFGKGGKKKAAAKKKAAPAGGGKGGGKIIDPDGVPNSGDEYRMLFGKKVPVK